MKRECVPDDIDKNIQDERIYKNAENEKMETGISHYYDNDNVSQRSRLERICNRNRCVGKCVEETETVSADWDGTTTESVYETENCRITFNLTGYWDGGYNASIRIENTGSKIIENWYLGFDYSNAISNIWNAEV